MIYKKKNSHSSRYKSQSVNYKGTPTSLIGGMDFDKDETKEEIEAKHETNYERVRREVGDEGISIIKNFVEGPICLQIPNLERAIKICCGNKIWCLDGVLKSMKEKPSCPLGREEITTEFFSKVEMSNFIVEALQSEPGKVSSLKGKDHKKELTGFCNTGDGFLGIRGIIEQHNGHDIIEIEAKYPMVTKKIQEEAQCLERNLGEADDLQSGIFDRGEKNKELLMSGVEPLLSLITENFKHYHQKSWGWFAHYMPKLDKIKEYQSTKTEHNKGLISQGLISNILELYSVQKELQKLNKALLEYQQNYKVLSKNYPFNAGKYSFEFKFDKPVGNAIIDAISKEIIGKLWIDEETVTIILKEVLKKYEAKLDIEETKENKDIKIRESKQKAVKDHENKKYQQIEINTEEEFKEEPQQLKQEKNEIEDIQYRNNEKQKYYLLFQEKKYDLFGTLKDPTIAHTFLGPISLSKPLCLPLASLLPDPLPSSSTIKFLLYEYSTDIGNYLSSSLNGVAESMQEGLKKTTEKLEMLDKVHFSVE